MSIFPRPQLRSTLVVLPALLSACIIGETDDPYRESLEQLSPLPERAREDLTNAYRDDDTAAQLGQMLFFERISRGRSRSRARLDWWVIPTRRTVPSATRRQPFLWAPSAIARPWNSWV